jgi:hypothetical protein
VINPPAADGSGAPGVTARSLDLEEVVLVNDATSQTLSRLTERRCWRCLRMFPRDDGHRLPMRDEHWLCDPCEVALLPSKQRAR